VTTKRARKRPLLVLSGGAETDDGPVARRIADEVKARRGKLVVCTTPSGEPETSADLHVKRYRALGVETSELDVRIREQAMDPASLGALDGAAAVLFTGGDQLRLTATLGDSLVFRRIREIYDAGGLVAGTSAGSAAMPHTMIVSGEGDLAPEAAEIGMAPGFGFVDGIVLDTHFAERGRIGRLVGAVAQNPKNLGLGIDEDTAIVVDGDGLQVVGRGAVYVVDGSRLTWSSLSGQASRGITSVFELRLHVLADTDCYSLGARQPRIDEAERRGERDELRDTARRSS
jgi:cyanophycinase